MLEQAVCLTFVKGSKTILEKLKKFMRGLYCVTSLGFCRKYPNTQCAYSEYYL